MENSTQYGLPTFSTASEKPWIPQRARNRPSNPPSSARTTLSISSCRMIRQRLAPSAARIETSRARSTARLSSMFATFAQAIRRTKPTAPSMSKKTSRMVPPFITSWKVWTRIPWSLLAVGKLLLQAVRHHAQVGPGFGDRTAFFQNPDQPESRLSRRSSCASGTAGIHRSSLFGNLKPSGITPAMTAGFSLMRTARPMTPASFP